ncbi:putative acid methyltransferase [Ixodes scapularis]
MHSHPRCQVPNTTDSPTATEESRPVPRFFPELYVKANALQRTVNIRVLELLQSCFRDKPSADQQQFMDLGCGTGDFTLQELLPRCQPCRRIVATDVAKEMVRYSRENYADPQIEYEVYDIADDASGLVKSYGKFDRVYSFFVLQWVKDQVTAFGHISDLMTSGGECLLTIVARWTGFEIWRRIVRMDRWKSYAQLCEFYTPVSHDIADHSGLISYMLDVLKTVNLVPYTCEVSRMEIKAEDMDETIGSVPTEVMHSHPRCQVQNTTDSPYPTATEESRPVPRFFPELYVKANAMQRTVNIRALELLQSCFRDKLNADQQQFMDLGCGTGDFTLQELLPRCQPCRRIVATDVAKEMVRYARENYPHPQIEYEVYDIADDASGLVKSYGKFDRLYSFFVLHWVKDQLTAFGHISDLMTSGGECLLTIVARWTGFEIWRRIVRMDRWKSYAQLCEFYTPVSHDIADHSGLISYMRGVLKTVNLVPYTCEVSKIEIKAEDMDETIGEYPS